jgi:ATP-dependent Lon protease
MMAKREERIPAFMKMDSFDAIQALDDAFKEKLLYEITYYDEKTKQKKTKYELTFIGIKQLILENAKNRDEAMQIVNQTVERVKINPENVQEDVWQATVILRNKKTGHETLGVSESDVYPLKHWPKLDANGKRIWNDKEKRYETVYERRYDPFGRTAAVAKAIRNAERQQLPEMAIQLFVEAALKKKDAVQKIDQLNDDGSVKTECDCPLGIRDWDYQNHICKQCGLPLPADAKKQAHACKCNDATKKANPKNNGICPVCNGVRF